MQFPTDYPSIINRINRIDPVQYARTRNYIDGAVTGLSPYLSRGVISLPQVRDAILARYKFYEAEKLLQELAWREYWQRVWQATGDGIFTDLRQVQAGVAHRKLPVALQHATTGINAVDESIRLLYKTGYMHNHFRMYTAAIACNIGQAHWLQPARWMYYHLLDGDLASNSLSWQWVAGAFSSKKYYCNQENINKYSKTQQTATFLDTGYESLAAMEKPPEALKQMCDFHQVTVLPKTNVPYIDTTIPTLVYNTCNLDPLWHNDIAANRILLLEPSHFTKYPVSNNVLNFIIALAANIPDIQVFTGEFSYLQQLVHTQEIVFKSHPAFTHYTGKAESYNYMFPGVSGYFASFSGYWKKCQKYLR
jgi:deoxyribodipyrimidine photo-lyase